MSRRVLVVAAHADDEALGCGGTLARHAAAGDEVAAIFVADGVSSRAGKAGAALHEREGAAGEAARLIGISSVTFLGWPDNRLDTQPLLSIVQQLEEHVSRLRPDIVYTHCAKDLNVDHRVTHQAVRTACRPLPESPVREVLAFEVMSSTEWGGETFRPTLYVDITGFIDRKRAALDAYRTEMRPSPHSRSMRHLDALAIHRGHSCGVEYAEAFEVLRIFR